MSDRDIPKFSKLEKVPLRQYFPNEANNFTRWLYQINGICPIFRTVGAVS